MCCTLADFGEIMKFETWLLKNGNLAILATLLIVTVTGYQLTNARINDDMRMFFGANNPHLQALESYEDTYVKNNFVILGLYSQEDSIFTQQNLQALRELTEKSWLLPNVLRADSISNFQFTSINDEGDLLVQPLYGDASTLNIEDLKSIRDRVLNNPELAGRLVSEDGRLAAVSINLNVARGGEGAKQAAHEAIEAVDQLIQELEAKFPQIEIRYTGGIYADEALLSATIQDLTRLLPLVVLIMAALMLFFLKSAVGTFATMVVVSFSAISALGVSVFFGIELSPTSAAAPVVILTVGIADSVHILVTYFQGLNRGLPKREAIQESLRVNHKPIFLTSLTTIIGFLSMNFNESPPFRDMGNIVALGVLFAYCYSIFFLPVLIQALPAKSGRDGMYRFRSIDLIESFVVRHHVGVFLALLAMIAGLGWSIQKIEFNDTFLEYMDESVEFRRNNDFFVQHLSGVEAIHYDIANMTGEEGSINEPNYLHQLGALKNWFNQQPEVLHVESYADIMYRLNKTWHDEDDAYYIAPESRELAAQYLLMFEMSLPAGLGVENFVNVSRTGSRMSVALTNAKTDEILDLDRRALAWAKIHTPDLVVKNAVGESVLFAHEAKRNLQSMLNGVYIALVLISAVILVALRNVKLGVLSLIPNTVPIVMAFGMWALIVGELGMSGASVLVIALGIIVDDTVHFLTKYQRARKELNLPTAEAIRYSFQTVGVALLVTSVILVCGFSVLFESAFQPSKDLGLLIALCVGLALIATFLLLPCLLMFLDRQPVPTSDTDEAETVLAMKETDAVDVPQEIDPAPTAGSMRPAGVTMVYRQRSD